MARREILWERAQEHCTKVNATAENIRQVRDWLMTPQNMGFFSQLSPIDGIYTYPPLIHPIQKMLHNFITDITGQQTPLSIQEMPTGERTADKFVIYDPGNILNNFFR